MKLILLLIALALSSELTFESFEAEEYSKYLSGFFSGLTKDNVECKASSEQLSKTLATISSEMQMASVDISLIYASYESLRREVESLGVACDVHGLILSLHKLMGPWGKSIVMKNYVIHSRQITADMAVLADCTSNFYNCGKSTGELLRLLTGWSIKLAESQTDSSELETAKNQMSQMVVSLAKNVEWIAPEYCRQFGQGEKDLRSMNLDQLASEWKNNEDLQDCAMHFSGMALYVLPSVVFNGDNWRNVLKAQDGQINSRINYLIKNCSSDFSACGEKLAEVVNLLLQYTNEL